ncbi:uncharacterized protein LOC120050827 [Salvelinus namaycush]|uniref:Uncharacterized protein LOC120050827 n=1 Tax=Salvelinus namaycush TaxID=8040 RepID=A0A8U0UGX8_SALNM|nr:uncharacterized protein LOC120050827 [Salvelinus namaycush]
MMQRQGEMKRTREDEMKRLEEMERGRKRKHRMKGRKRRNPAEPHSTARLTVREDLYHKVGGELVLTPEKSTVPDFITSILWKHGKNKVAEWDKDFGSLDIYAAFKERTTLDQTTGELRISGLMKTDSGVYSVEFNSKLLDKTYKRSVIKAVPKPTITSSCNANQTSCTLTCEGNTTDAEPVTYSWKVGEGAWEVVDKQLSVSKSDSGKSNNGYKYICKLKNAVSEEVSEPVGEVFGPEAVPKPTITSSCNPDKTSCTLTCEGDTTDAEPVTYSWKVGERAWEVLYKQRNVSKSDTGKSNNGYKYICKLKNAVSEEVSEPVGEVFGPEAVPKPTITSSCNANQTSCTLTCEGNTTDAEPVTYSWKVGEGAWEVVDKQLSVSKSDSGKSNNGYKYICKLKNAVSEEVSEPVGEVFGPEAVPKPTITSSCNPDKTSCTLTCEGDTTDAEPVTYSWKVGERASEVVDKQLIVSKSDSGKLANGYKYTCKLKNAVSEEVSEPVGEVFGPEAVPKPTITSSCNPDKTSCTLTCEGDTTDAEPVTYSWKVGERAWEVLYKQRNVSKSDTGKSNNGYKYICKLKNAVSEEVSEPVGEVFGPEPSSIGAVVALVVCLIVAFAVITGLLVWKKKTGYPQNTWIDFLRKYFVGMFAKGSDVVQPEQGKFNADKAEKVQGKEGGDDKTKANGSAAPGGDLNAAEKGEANGEGSVLLNEDTVKYDNGKGAAEENSAL